MTAYDLSILVPGRNEMFLGKTIENILENIEGKTEVIAVLDGYTVSIPELPKDPRVTIVNLPKSIGQRAAANVAARLSNSKYLMKCDAHCSFDKGFDIKMIREMHDDWTMVPLMRNLHAFDWVCPDGHRRYQGPSGPCIQCGKPTVRDILWKAKESPKSISYCFDSTPHFQYFGEYTKRPGYQGDITETMSLQGSCWMLTRNKYWDLGICDEKFGSWGSQGIEVAVKTWLSGGRVMVNKKTWYAHMFRTQGGDFSFPYPISVRDQEKAKSFARDLFFNNNWSKQVRPLSWLIEKFWPVKGWTEEDLAKLKANTFKFKDLISELKPIESEPLEDKLPAEGIIYQDALTKGIIFCTDNQVKLKIAHKVQDILKSISKEKNIPITSASLKKMTFGDKNIHFPSLKKGYYAMLKQILGALENSKADIIFLCEPDVLYHPSHFDFTPPRRDIFYYNQNWWQVGATNGVAVRWDANQLWSLCGYREHLLRFYRKLFLEAQKNGENTKGFESSETNPKLSLTWKSEFSNINIGTGQNLVKNRHFTTATEIPGWGETKELIKGLL